MKNSIRKIIFGGVLPVFILSLFSGSVYSEIVEGFPEGCAYASIGEPLPDHQLRFGRIRWEGAAWILFYIDQNAPGPLLMSLVAENLGMIGQDPSLYFGLNLRTITPYDNYVIAQVLNRDIIGLPPIVTCVSRVFMGRIMPYRPIPYGSDYYEEVERYRDCQFDDHKRERWHKWRKNRDHIRKLWRGIKQKHDRDRPSDRKQADSKSRFNGKNDKTRPTGRIRVHLKGHEEKTSALLRIGKKIQGDKPKKLVENGQGRKRLAKKAPLDDDDQEEKHKPIMRRGGGQS